MLNTKTELIARGWQVNALAYLNDYYAMGNDVALVEASPGSGKTHLSAFMYDEMADKPFIIAVVPGTNLQQSFMDTYHKHGINLSLTLKADRPLPKEYHGSVITYAALMNVVGHICRSGRKIVVVADEAHHCAINKAWGIALNQLIEYAERTLLMSGTPFRTDGEPICGVRYDANGKAIPVTSYPYSNAVGDKICRALNFTHDAGMAEYIFAGELNKINVEDATTEELGKVGATIFSPRGDWIAAVALKAQERLIDYTRDTDSNAAGIIVCRPGRDDGEDDKNVDRIAKKFTEVTGEDVLVITHKTKDADALIDRFRRCQTRERWICTVRKISEGVDIPRLRVMFMAMAPTTELLFRQLTGRVIRGDGDAWVFCAAFAQLLEWSQRIKDEAAVGLKDQERQTRERDEDGDPRETSGLDIIASEHEDGQTIAYYGGRYTADDIKMAEQFKNGDPELQDVSVLAVAHLMRKMKKNPAPKPVEDKPLAVRKGEVRKKISQGVRAMAINICNSNPPFNSVWSNLNKRFGFKSIDDLTDNHTLERMQEVLEYINNHRAKSNASV